MADYYGTTLCRHGFAVNNPDEFEKELRKYGLTKEEEGREGCLWYDRHDDTFEIYGYTSLDFYDADRDMGANPEEVIQTYLKEFETAVFIEVGTTKCRYNEGGGFAVIITKNKVEHISLRNWVEDKLIKIRNENYHIGL